MTEERGTRERIRADELRRRIARVLMAVEPGHRLPTVRSLASRLGASLGATQEALARLESEGAIAVDRRGRHGATLVRRTLGQLWHASEGVPLVVALPLPSTRRIEGLATAVKGLLADSGVEAFLAFSRGSRHRLLDLRQGRCHAAVMSALAARELSGPDEIAVLELPARSFVREHRVYVTDSAADVTGMRVVMDRDSLDFQLLTELEFGDVGATFVPATYMQFPRLLAERRADAVIWDVEEAEARMPAFVTSRPLSPRVLERVGESDLQAVFVARRADDAVQRTLAACLGHAEFMRIHREVVEGRRVPEY